MGSLGKSTDFGDVITASWKRCRSYGLSHGKPPVLEQLDQAQQKELAEQHGFLVRTTQCEVLPYYENILANSQSQILLTDRLGRVLNNWGDQRFVDPGRKAYFAAGTNWQEKVNGTNAIGTAIACGKAVQVQRNEHFLKANRFMVGSAAPIFDVERDLVGVLNVSSDAYLPQAHTLGMVRLMSQSVENRLMIQQFSGHCFMLTVNTNFDNVDSQWSGLIAYDDDCRILAFNRRAEQLIGEPLTGLNMAELLEFPVASLLNQPDFARIQSRTKSDRLIHGLLRRPTEALPQGPDRRTTKAGQSLPPNTGSRQKDRLTLDNIEFGDRQMARCIEQAKKLINKDIPLLIQGETGAGKEVFVKALHQSSDRRNAPMVAVNCAAIPAELVESELFGYEKGAFTGASPQGATGLIRKADQGLLFLDEIGEMPLGAQARLLRVLQEREVTPLGSTQSYPVDIKLVSATNQPLRDRIASGNFRQDLFYRITGLGIELPALRDRTDLRQVCRRIHHYHCEPHQHHELSESILDVFERHSWPGNIRQLSSVIQVALAMADDEQIEVWHLPDDFIRDIEAHSVSAPGQANPLGARSPEAGNDEPEGPSHMLATYTRYKGNVARTARHLDISRNTLYKRLKAAGVR